jgi:hypothetical protein
MAAAELAQGPLPTRGQLPWGTVRSAGAIPQTGAALVAEALPPFVTGGTGDVETATEPNEGLALGQSREDKSFTSGKQRTSKPRHARSVHPPKV